MGNIHRAITVSVNEVCTKASSELMKNSDVGIRVEQLDSLIREQTRPVGGPAKVIGPQANSGLGPPPPQSRPDLIMSCEELNMRDSGLPDCASRAERERNPGTRLARPWASTFLGLCSECSQRQIVKSPPFLAYSH